MVRIRLKRIGQRNRPHYRIVVIERTRSRDGKYIESIGHYDPRSKALVVDAARAEYWLSKGAQPSDTAKRLLHRKSQFASTPPTAPVPTDVQVAPGPETPDTTIAASEGGKDETTG